MIRRSPIRIAIVVTALLAVSAIVLLGGLLENPPDTSATRPVQVQSVTPAPGSTVQPTEEIGVDLESGLEARFYIDGKAIPPQAVRDENNGRFRIRPGAAIDGGVPVPALRAGLHFVNVVYWDRELGQNNKNDLRAGQYRWEFTSA